MTKAYDKVVRPYVYSEPDIMYAPLTPENYDLVEEKLPSLVDDYYERYLESLEKPMPFFIGTPQSTNLGITFHWDSSYDFDQEDITYKVVVARDLECTDVVYQYEGKWVSFKGDYLPEGQYFVRATATNESGYTQDAFDYYETEHGKEYGRLCFYVDADGNITRYSVEE
jgi:spore coat protein H